MRRDGREREKEFRSEKEKKEEETVWMPEFGKELEIGRTDWEVGGERHVTLENSSLVWSSGWTFDPDDPLVKVALVGELYRESFDRIAREIPKLVLKEL